MNQLIEIKPGSAPKVMSGEKILTIQKGRRLYELGDAVLLDPLDNTAVNVEILRVAYCKLKNTPLVELALHGEKRWQDLLEYLQQYYPEIKKNNTITIIRYKYVKSVKDSDNL